MNIYFISVVLQFPIRLDITDLIHSYDFYFCYLMRIFLIYHKIFHPNEFYKDFFKSKIFFSFLIYKIPLYGNALYAFPYPLG